MTESALIRPGNGRVMQQARIGARRYVAPERVERFIDRLAESCNVRWSAEQAGLLCSTLYRIRARDAVFRGAWDEAIETGYARLEAGLVARALESVERAPAETVAAPVSFAEAAGLLRDARRARGRVRAPSEGAAEIEPVKLRLERLLVRAGVALPAPPEGA